MTMLMAAAAGVTGKRGRRDEVKGLQRDNSSSSRGDSCRATVQAVCHNNKSVGRLPASITKRQQQQQWLSNGAPSLAKGKEKITSVDEMTRQSWLAASAASSFTYYYCCCCCCRPRNWTTTSEKCSEDCSEEKETVTAFASVGEAVVKVVVITINHNNCSNLFCIFIDCVQWRDASNSKPATTYYGDHLFMLSSAWVQHCHQQQQQPLGYLRFVMRKAALLLDGKLAMS
ncbi:hypothetical protein TYRP_021384 [Tyrophagus putrescentiae]|nr:hypothetical protein TYRP_021384 [Tyrophagus putrescentiae]